MAPLSTTLSEVRMAIAIFESLKRQLLINDVSSILFDCDCEQSDDHITLTVAIVTGNSLVVGLFLYINSCDALARRYEIGVP